MTKITLENEFGKSSIELKENGLSITQVIEELIAPLLLASGYHIDNVKDVLKLED